MVALGGSWRASRQGTERKIPRDSNRKSRRSFTAFPSTRPEGRTDAGLAARRVAVEAGVCVTTCNRSAPVSTGRISDKCVEEKSSKLKKKFSAEGKESVAEASAYHLVASGGGCLRPPAPAPALFCRPSTSMAGRDPDQGNRLPPLATLGLPLPPSAPGPA